MMSTQQSIDSIVINSDQNTAKTLVKKKVFFTFSVLVIAFFAIWWFYPSHIPANFSNSFKILDILLFLMVSWIVWHPILMSVLLWTISLHIKDQPEPEPIDNLKVAFITTIVPRNEPLCILHECLPAMVNTHYEHDTWLLDEENSPEVKEICQLYGVKHFSRAGKEKYYTSSGKYTRTKGGNHNSWYDSHGNDYDVVAQIDVDFVPNENFLIKTLGYFRDPKVAFVGTPQTYGNTKDSIIALGAAEQQYSFYGSILRGLSNRGMTLLIGANHVIRVKALKDVDHYTGHITEDLITGMELHAKGWKSVYVPYTLAIGEGPSTWSSYFDQQMRWAYGCIDILFTRSFKLYKTMGLRNAIYYFFLQQHYFSGVTMALSTLLIGLYFLTGMRAANIDLLKFLTFYSLVSLITWLMSTWMQKFNVQGEEGGDELLLAGKIVSIAAWPIWFIAFFSVILRKRLRYKVTPKGENGHHKQEPLSLFIPHFIFGAIAVIGLLSSFFTDRQNALMVFWALSSALLMFTVPFTQSIVGKLSKVHTLLPKKTSDQSIVTIKNIHITPKTEAYKDITFLTIISVISYIPYIGKLGFYSDDWSFLGNFALSQNQSIFGLIQTATTPNTFMRPVQNVYDSLLYWFFGINPLGYHLINSTVLLFTAIMFYLILRQLKVARIITVAAPLLFTLLPNYSTDRFWYAAFQIGLSMFFYLFSLYAGLMVFNSESTRKFRWKVLCLFSLLISGLSYEITLPLFFLNMMLFWNTINSFIDTRKFFKKRDATIFNLVSIIFLLYIVTFKAVTTIRFDRFNYPEDIAKLLVAIFRVNFIELSTHFIHIWKNILSYNFDPSLIIWGLFLAAIIFWYLYYVVPHETFEHLNATYMRNLTFVGLIVFVFGYGIFFTNNRVGFSPTGIDNRVAVAATIGIALTLIGIVGFYLTLLPKKLGNVLFSAAITIISVTGFFVISTLSSYWIEAHDKQQYVLGSIYRKFPALPEKSTIIIDGVCPYVGPAVVFESHWDLKGALQLKYKDPTLQADIVTPRLEITENGINTQIYTFEKNYSYNNMFLYNLKDHNTYQLANYHDALTYFQNNNIDRNGGCPDSRAGHGVDIF